jgi:DNA-binding SARP family transcriptional activator
VAVDYQVLGPLEARVDGRAVDLGGPRQRGVLVLLLARANEVVPATRLADELWGDPPATAINLVQGYVSHLRKALGREAIGTRSGSYVVRVERDALDLHRFERLAHEGSTALADGDPDSASALLGEALALWKGTALADLADEPAAQPIAARLEELRLLALERRLEAEVACGRHAESVPAIEELVHSHPLRERLRWLQMLALYRSGRQSEALDAFRSARTTLVEELGIEPGPDLRELEAAILLQDPSLAPAAAASPGSQLRTIVAVGLDGRTLDTLLALAEPLAREPPREVVVVRTVATGSELGPVTADLRARREAMLERGAAVRVAAFTSVLPGGDVARLATEHDVDLVLADAPDLLLEDARLKALLEGTLCDVGIVVAPTPPASGHVFVPFAGGEHDWAAVELGAWLARNTASELRLGGAAAGVSGRDASRLLANVSIAVQRVLGIAAEPVLADPSPEALVEAAAGSAVVVVGLTERWRREGLGRTRTALATRGSTTVLVRRGVRPGGLAPRDSETRFTWTIAG